MHRFFVSPAQIGNLITITGSDVNHITRVLRLKTGDEIIVADGTGWEYLAELTVTDPERVEAVIKEKFLSHQEPPLDVYLLQGLTKGEKMDLIIQKCTEIGIKKIIPVQMERTVLKLTEEKAEKRRERWKRISFEAAKQCQRSKVPEIMPVCEFSEAINQLPQATVIIMPWEEEKGYGLKQFFKTVSSITAPVALIIGPEGGISPKEEAYAAQQGAVKVSLGPRILRTETAGLVALTIIMYELGDLGGNTIGQS